MRNLHPNKAFQSSGLAMNGVQAMPNGGKLNVNVFRETNTAVLTVEDTGVGIPEGGQT
jgi:signal transduction histidine kinase